MLFVVIKYFCGVKIDLKGKYFCDFYLRRKSENRLWNLLSQWEKSSNVDQVRRFYEFCLCNWNFFTKHHVTSKLVQRKSKLTTLIFDPLFCFFRVILNPLIQFLIINRLLCLLVFANSLSVWISWIELIKTFTRWFGRKDVRMWKMYSEGLSASMVKKFRISIEIRRVFQVEFMGNFDFNRFKLWFRWKISQFCSSFLVKLLSLRKSLILQIFSNFSYIH